MQTPSVQTGIRYLLYSFLAVSAAVFPSAANAQVLSGRFSGTITDTSGAVIPAAHVSVTNTETALTKEATTDEKGYYEVINLPVGIYSVRVELSGFAPAERTGYNLVADGKITADFVLQPGTSTQTVVVTAAAGEGVNTVSSELSRVVDTEQVQNLALNGRNYMQLASLIPGAALLDEDQLALTTSLSVTNQSINGNRGNTNNLMVDGAFNVDAGSNGSQISSVGVDFIREVNIKTSNFSAEYGRQSGAAVNVITRSGTNQFHGAVFEFFRNDALDARNFFSPRKAKLRFNDFGWDLGGPVVKNKLFFFAGEEWKKIRQDAAPLLATLPTNGQLAGNFGSTALFLPGTRTPVLGNNIASLITGEGKAIASVYNLMKKSATSYTDTATANNAVYQFPNPFNWREDLIRLDYTLSAKQSLYFRFIHDDYNLVDPFPVSGLPTVPINRVRPAFNYQLGDVTTFSANLVNEARINAAWTKQRRQPVTDTWERSTYGFTYPQVFNGGPYENGIPAVTITGYTNFQGPTFIILSPTTDISGTDNLTWVKNAHTLKFGVNITRGRKDQNGRANHSGAVAFSTSGNTNTTGNVLADALLGNYRTYGESNDDPVGFFRYTLFEGYAQDNWKVSRKLNLELGLRYQYGVPLYTQANNWSNFDPSLYNPAQAVTVTPAGVVVAGSGNLYNGLVRAGAGVPTDEIGRVPGATSPAALSVPAGAPRGLYAGQSKWAPRFGFAYSPDGDKTSIRGGFGLFYDHPDGNNVFSNVNNPPYLSSVALENGNLSNPAAGRASSPTPFSTVYAIDPHLQIPYTENFSFSVQRQLGGGFFVEGAYVGNLGRHLLRQPEINQPDFAVLTRNASLPSSQQSVTNALRPYKGFSSIRETVSDSTSNYHALQLYTTKRTGDLTLTGSYTFSKALSDSSSESDNPENPTDRHYSYGPTSFDRRHILVFTYTYRIPFARNRSPIVKTMVGGWELSGINRYQTGPYFTVVGNTSIGSRRADYIGGSVSLPSDQQTVAHYFNTAAFTPANNNRYGTAGVGTVQGPGLFLWDLSARKQFRITERVGLRFQADFFNILNVANFRTPVVDASNLAFGSLTAAGPARNIQFGAKLEF
jgi:hypothetical protein